MKKLTTSFVLISSLAIHGLSQAGPQITQGGYLLEDAYADYDGGIDAGSSGCFYIQNTPAPMDPLAAFDADLEFDSGFSYELKCSRALKGKVKHQEGKESIVVVADDKSSDVTCVGEELNNPFIIAFSFRIAGSGSKAKLLDGQITSNKGENILFPKKIERSGNCD